MWLRLKRKRKDLKAPVDNIQERLGEAEQGILDVKDMHEGMEKNIEKCDNRLETLWT